MVDKKDDAPQDNADDQQLVRKVDEMMNVRGEAPDGSKPLPPKSDLSSVAASVNEALAQDLTTSEDQPVQATAPELPAEEAEVPPIEAQLTEVGLPNQPEPEVSPTTELEEPPVNPTVEGKATDQAVEEIVAGESDKLLAMEDAKLETKRKAIVSKDSFRDKLSRLFHNRRAWLMVGVLLLIIFGLPLTRYKVLGLAIKKSVTISVIDSKTSSPVSNADVDLSGATAKTDANGKAIVRASLGKKDLTITKRYYKHLNTSYFVGFKSAKSSATKLVATGRLVPVIVLNKISGQPVAGAQIQAEGTTSKTNNKGSAEIALPVTDGTFKGKLSLKGYNDTDITIQVTDKVVKANNFEITPAGQVYFLSNLSGNLDVVKSNLDGSGRKTILAGTGKEDPRTTSLLAARDWRYLVLKSHHEGSLAALYIIDTSTDKVTQFDNTDADFSLIGWYDHAFVYSLTKNGMNDWQPGRQVIKSYDADHSQLNQIDQNQAEGTSNSYALQNFFNFYILDGQVVYTTEWNKQGVNSSTFDLSAKNDSIRAAQPNGQNKKDYQTFQTVNTNFIQATLYEPQAIYYAVYDSASKPTYYTFENQVVKSSTIDQSSIDKSYPTFLLSPSGKSTFWTELRDGKNALFSGDSNAQSKKQLASLSDYSPYGWYSDNFLLISKSSSQLYVTTPAGLTAARPPLKITDYYKPAQNYAGYGYGYGGL